MKNNERQKRWYLKNRLREQKRKLKYYYQYQEKHKISARKKRKENLRSWEGYLPTKTNCQCCGKEIYFNKVEMNSAIHFDHKDKDSPIKVNPTAWLANRKRILKNGGKKNQEIWEQCGFGMLCKRCNTYLPTINREIFVQNLVKYVFGKKEELWKTQ